MEAKLTSVEQENKNKTNGKEKRFISEKKPYNEK
tara:strand:+ start:1437 stop:1538 length:102 start_codon:yes stop_codon:yes gene_type:complete